MTGYQTAHEAAEAQLRRHRQEPRDFAVEADGQWPTLHQAFEAISHDGGASAGHDVYFVPEAWTEELDAVEAALHGLSAEDLEAFAIGEASETEAIAARSPALTAAHALLNAFFEDFPDVMPPPERIARGGWKAAEVQVKGMIAANAQALRQPSCPCGDDDGLPCSLPGCPYPWPRAGARTHFAPVRACRACGCTETRACLTGEGPCGWTEADLCTACVALAARIFDAPALRFLLLACGVVSPGASTSRPGADTLTGEGVLVLQATLKRMLETLPGAAEQTRAQS